MVELNQRARVEEIRGQGSTFPAFGDDVGGHGAGNLCEPPPNFLKPWSRFSILLLAAKSLDILDGETRSSGSRGLDHTYAYVFVLSQIQRLQRAQHAIFVHGVNLERHASIVSRESAHGCMMLNHSLGRGQVAPFGSINRAPEANR